MTSKINSCEMLSVYKCTRVSKYYNSILSKQSEIFPSKFCSLTEKSQKTETV